MSSVFISALKYCLNVKGFCFFVSSPDTNVLYFSADVVCTVGNARSYLLLKETVEIMLLSFNEFNKISSAPFDVLSFRKQRTLINPTCR